MAVDPKILSKFEKLMRLAAPDSGTTEHERSSAALEAARLYHEHKLSVGEAEEPESRSRRPKGKRRNVGYGAHVRTGPHWIMSVTISDVLCEDCGSYIGPGVNVWMKTDGTAYVHRPIYT